MIETKVKIIEIDSNQRSGSSKCWYQRSIHLKWLKFKL